MKKWITLGASLLLLLPLSTIFSFTGKAGDAQYNGEIIVVFIVGKYTTAQHQFHFPCMSIDISCNSGDILITGFVWYRAAGYAVPVPGFTFDYTRTHLEVSKFIGVCRLHHVIGIGM